MNEEGIKILIIEIRNLKREVEHKSGVLNELKETLREILIDSGIDEINGVKMKRSFSLDTGLFKMKYPELAKTFIKEETITKIKDVVDKKGLQKHAPEEYRECLVELTARLYGL